ncbi:peptidoglycan DD-metalloendopeptidase family protein [Patescibacteria group bacterium]|nr:peptidoglycan DD-metalloendopeptidase family protein [Patescibacteria group bacterium]
MKLIRFIILILIVLSMGFYGPGLSSASKVEELQNQIENRSSSISELEKEIAEYQKQIQKVSEEKQTLNNEVYRLNLDKKKLTSDITLTNNRIYETNLDIEDLTDGIGDKEKRIKNNTIALSETMRLIYESDSNSLVEILLSTDDISDFWGDVEDLQRFQIGVRERTFELQNLKTDLEENKKLTEEKERELLGYRADLSDKKEIVEYNKKEKDQLLSTTKNKESEYKKILAEKEKLREAFLQEIQNLESQLKMVIDPNSIPDTGKGVISWPLDSIFITQYFGKTEFSTKNPQVYSGNGHNGIDFRASSGTKIKSVSGGVVKGTGNTDTVPAKCYSYGKWVLIEHENGLTSLYAHLSLIKVVPGQVVNRGDVIGYSGNTGYSTGPHLHFGLYASSGVKIEQFTKSINCKDKFVPIAPYSAYLNPLSYFPEYK